ncbi:MAG: siphovirus Gp157 family protein [Oscillospiraceae bacterium]|jgi:hypothetical protein
MSLFQLSEDYQVLYDQLDDIDLEGPEGPELFEAFADTLEGIEIEFDEKAEKIACFIKDLNYEASAIKTEKQALDKRQKAKEKKADQLKHYLMGCMERAGKQKIERPLASMSIRNNAESLKVENDLDFIRWAQASGRDDLIRYKDPDIDKTALKKAVKDGLSVSGVTLERSRSLTIK